MASNYDAAIRVVLGAQLAADLDELARAKYCSKSAVVRQEVARAVAEYRATQTRAG